MEDAVEWRVDAANSPLIRLIVYSWMGFFGAGIVLLYGLLFLVGISLALSGDATILALFLLILLVGGPISVVYIGIVYASGTIPTLSSLVVDIASEPRESITERYAQVLTWRRAGVAIVCHCILIPLFFWIDFRLVYAYLGLLFGGLLITAGLTTWGRIDPTTLTFEYGTSTIPLHEIDHVYPLQIRGLILGWITYAARQPLFSTPQFVVFTPEAAAVFEYARSKCDAEPPAGSVSDPYVTITAAIFGLGLMGLAWFLWTYPGINPGFAVYASGIFGLLGIFFLYLGWHYR